jgi:hypothetical protein
MSLTPLGLFNTMSPEVAGVTVSGLYTFQNISILSQGYFNIHVVSDQLVPASTDTFYITNYPKILNISCPTIVKRNEPANINIYLFGDDLLFYASNVSFEAKIGDTVIASMMLNQGKGNFNYLFQQAGDIVIDTVTTAISTEVSIFRSFGISISFGKYLSLSISLIWLLC